MYFNLSETNTFVNFRLCETKLCSRDCIVHQGLLTCAEGGLIKKILLDQFVSYFTRKWWRLVDAEELGRKAITIAAKFRDCLGARRIYRAIVVVSVGTSISINLPRIGS